MFVSCLLILFVSAFSRIPSTNAAPCKAEDGDCFKEIIVDVLKNTVDGIPALRIEPLDPLYLDAIDASIADLNLKFINVTIEGLKKCVVAKARVTEKVLDWELHCPKMAINSKYEANGQLLMLPVHGEGDAWFNSGKVVFSFTIEYAIMEKSDGKQYIQFTNYKLKGDPKEPITFELSNLFNGQKLLSDTFHDFANTNWKEISDLFLDSVMTPTFKVILTRINKYLKEKLTKEDLLLD